MDWMDGFQSLAKVCVSERILCDRKVGKEKRGEQAKKEKKDTANSRASGQRPWGPPHSKALGRCPVAFLRGVQLARITHFRLVGPEAGRWDMLERYW